MCMFCAAVPTVAALGFARAREAEAKDSGGLARGEPPPRPLVPAGKATAAALAAIVVVAVVYHTQVASV